MRHTLDAQNGRTLEFHKYQALGNDYVVLEAEGLQSNLQPHSVRLLCDRHFGIGSDGILVEGPAPQGAFGLRILTRTALKPRRAATGCASSLATCGTPDEWAMRPSTSSR